MVVFICSHSRCFKGSRKSDRYIFSGNATLSFSSFHLSKPTNILNEILKSFLTKKHSDLFADNSELEIKHIALETFDLSDITNETESPRPTHSYHVLLNMFPI